MKTYMICYDLLSNETIKDYQRIIDAIKSIGQAEEIQRSVWLLRSGKHAIEIRNILQNYLDSNDKLFIGGLDENAYFNLSSEINNKMFPAPEWNKS
ncbi:CRISPR-associated protein Cas2 [Priestia megaterium]